MNTHEAVKFLEQQSRMAVKRHNDACENGQADMAQKFSILADLYMTFAGALGVLAAGRPQFSHPLPDLESTDRGVEPFHHDHDYRIQGERGD